MPHRGYSESASSFLLQENKFSSFSTQMFLTEPEGPSPFEDEDMFLLFYVEMGRAGFSTWVELLKADPQGAPSSS